MRLKTDYIDLFQVHWPNPDIPLDDTFRAMEKLVSDGKVKYIGVSNFTVKEITEVLKILKSNELASVQTEYNLFERSIEEELLPLSEKYDFAILAYSPLAQGRLANGKVQIKIIEDLARKYDANPAQIILQYLIKNQNQIQVKYIDLLKI
jgi:aryl-alcohol dehydrogenase-like predicted oxidoreductase